ncbi:hypothetical protein J7J41_00320 [bacterium]|nr:hypothetical protein [bacterium]
MVKKERKNNEIDEAKKKLDEIDEKLRILKRRSLKANNLWLKKATILSWSFFAPAYLEISRLGCMSLLKKKKFKDSDKFLLLPIVYNLRHALEIMMKSFIQKFDSNYSKTHNIGILYKELEKKIKNGNCRKILDEIYLLVVKYQQMPFFKEGFKEGLIAPFWVDDRNNTLLRYPGFVEVSIFIDFNNLFFNIDDFTFRDMLEDIKTDIETVIDIMHKWRSVISSNKKSVKK